MNLSNWHPQPHTDADTLDPAQANRLARTLNSSRTYVRGDELPPTWHWVYFSDWPATADLGHDGHPAHGEFFPPIPNRRRMFAGARVESIHPLVFGENTTRTSAVTSIEPKTGRTGDMVFITMTYEYSQHRQLCLREKQTIVYRSDSGAHRPFTRATDQLTPSAMPWSMQPQPNSATLFRYSALTSNSHRIHYDHDYVTDVEGYPDIVVHGPLLATYMANLVCEQSGRALGEYQFRLTRPLFLGDSFQVEATCDGNAATMRVVSGGGAEHATATGVLR